MSLCRFQEDWNNF